jgi:hypothetical protein
MKTAFGLLACVMGFCVAGVAQAQTVPCYSAAQCAQIRTQGQEQQAARESADEVLRQANADKQRTTAHAEAEQAHRQGVARAQRAIQMQADADVIERRNALFRAAAEAREEQAAQDRAVAEIHAREEAAEARARARIEDENRAATQFAAENSPDNHCKDRAVAGELLQNFNGLLAVRDQNIQAVDIDHLTTVDFDKVQHIYVCQGAFLMTNGVQQTGTISTRLNIAGNVIAQWHADRF